MSNEEMIVALNTVVEALGRHDLEIILADNKRLREENERLNRDIEMTRAVWKADKLIQQECGARNMLNYVTRHYAVNKVATDDEVFKYWKDERGK